MDRLIRHRATIHFLLLMLLGQFIGTAWSCPMEAETAPASSAANYHGEHQAHMRTDEHTENNSAVSSTSLSSEQEPSEVAPCCDDDSTCPTHHCSALNLVYLFETQGAPPADKLQSFSYKNPIKRSPSALYRPPITSLSQA